MTCTADDRMERSATGGATRIVARNTMKIAACLGAALMIASAPLGAGERLALKVSPAVSFAPANLVVRATIEADAANRAVQVSAESIDFYRSSEIELDGENAPRTNTFEFRSLTPEIGRASCRERVRAWWV